MIKDYLKLAEEGIYPSKKEWFSKYGKHGVDYQALLTYKKENLTKIELKTVEGTMYFNERYISPIMKTYYQTQEIGLDSLSHFIDTFEDILIFSEVEGTLEIEGVKTSKRKIEDVLGHQHPHASKEQIILNMKNGIDFISNHEITEDNLYHLYQLLSENCLEEDELITDGYYRSDNVDIIGKYGEVSDRGADAKVLSEWMSDFIKFIQENMMSLNVLTYLMPHIIHYYVITLHPYYDFNGRTARMLAYWYIMKCPYIKDKMPIFSEAINFNSKTKAQYYRAIENSREDGNDLTFFFEMMFSVGKKFVDVYLKLDSIERQSRSQLSKVTKNELNVLKSIMLYTGHALPFTWEDVSHIDKEQYSKQYYLKLLNSLCDKSILYKTVRNKQFFYQIIEG